MPRNFFFDATEIIAPKPKRPAPTGCEACGLDKDVITPRMEPHGRGRLGILIVGEAPSEKDDQMGRPFSDRPGEFQTKSLAKADIDMTQDCKLNNPVQCRPMKPDNRDPDPHELQCCSARLDKQIAEFAPDVILALGTPAIQEVLKEGRHLGLSATSMHGRVVPSVLRKCPVVCGFHPSYYLHADHDYDLRMDEISGLVLKALTDRRKPKLLDPSAYSVVEDVDAAVGLLDGLSNSEIPVALDYETTGLNPWKVGFKPLLIGLAVSPNFALVIPLEHPHARWKPGELDQVYAALRKFLQSNAPKVIQNWQYEELVSLVYPRINSGISNVVVDTMVREHILDNRAGICGQEFQEFVRYGESAHKNIRKDDLAHEFLDTVARYCALDARYCIQWKIDQDGQMDPDLERAYSLFHRAIPLFARMKIRGMRVDAGILDVLDRDVKAELAALRPDAGLECLKTYRAKYGTSWEANSTQARQKLFFDVMGLKPLRQTKTGWSTDAETVTNLIEQLPDGSEERLLLNALKDKAHLDKLAGYIKNARELTDGGAIHPSFLLHTVSSYRSSSADPNFQNFPIRLPRLAVLRTAFVPRNDWLMEIDFSGAEVRAYAVNTQDRTLISHIRNNVDYHRHYAALLYEKPEDEITKEERYKGKNGFIFPEFYGDVADSIARSNPQWRRERIREVEKIFWGDLPFVKKWQNETWTFYKKHGFVKYLNGFVVRLGKEGMLSYNQCCNLPNQGLAFHRLLECLLKQEIAMREAGLVSTIIGQIHDSVVIDVVDGEVDRVIELAEPTIRTPVWGFDSIVPWGADIKIGRNLLAMEKV